MHIDHNKGSGGLSTRELREFGLIMAAALSLVFGLLLPWLFGFPMPRWPWIAAAVFVALALLVPRSLQPLYWAWMRIGAAIGWVNTRIILALVFYVMLFPMGVMMRLLAKDPMARSLDSKAPSYRVRSEKTPLNRLEKPF